MSKTKKGREPPTAATVPQPDQEVNMPYPTNEELEAQQEPTRPYYLDQLQDSLVKHGLASGSATAEVLGCTEAEGEWLWQTGGEVRTPVYGDPNRWLYVPTSVYPAAAGRLLGRYRKLCAWAVSNQPVRRPASEGRRVEADEAPPAGDLSVEDLAWLRQGARGETPYTASVIPTPVQRVQALGSTNVSVTTFARAVGVDVDTVTEWLSTPSSELPWANPPKGWGEFLTTLKFLAAGPLRPNQKFEAPNRKKVPSGATYF